MVKSGAGTASLLASLDRSTDVLLSEARAIYAEVLDEASSCVDAATRLLSGYDICNMHRAATICHWGRSGSVLLASFLDSHPDILILPVQLSESIYPFLDRYGSLTIWQKLLTYPAFSRREKLASGDFFLANNPDGDFAIRPAQYFAGIAAMYQNDDSERPEGRAPRGDFLRYLHVAYALAINRAAANPQPIIVCAQHWWNEQRASQLSEDFPGAKFLHTIRDPISAFDAWLEMHFKWQLPVSRSLLGGHPYPVFDAYRDLLSWDRPHQGMDARSRAIRFEDMHNAPDTLMNRIAEWLGIGIQALPVESTLNGKPYVVFINGKPVSGSDPLRARRRSGNLNSLDRLVIFALLHRNFVDWQYPSPPAMRSALLRGLILLAGSVVPSKMEIANIRILVQRQILPAARAGRIGSAIGALLAIGLRRVRFMALILRGAASRIQGGVHLLRLI